MKIKALLLLSFVLLSTQLLVGQTSTEFSQLRGSNVPTQSITYAIEQDSIGNIWIASEEGVLKHNSKFYQIYNSYKGLPSNMNNRVTALHIDSSQQIWIGLEKGLCRYNPDLDEFEIIKTDIDLNPSLITGIVEDDEGNIWIGGFNGLWKYAEKESTQLSRMVANQNIQALCYTHGHLVFGTQKAIFNYNPEQNILKQFESNQDEDNISMISMANNQLLAGTKSGQLLSLDATSFKATPISLNTTLEQPITDVLWHQHYYFLATDGAGLFKFDENFKSVDHFYEDSNTANSLSSNGIYDLELDRENLLWIATYGGGVNYFNIDGLPFVKVQHILNKKNSLVSDFTRAIAKDKNGLIWFGTKKGLSIWDPTTDIWKHIPKLEQTSTTNNDIILALEPDGNMMWVGTYNHGLFKIDVDNLKLTHLNKQYPKKLIQKIYAILNDADGNIWIGGIDGNLTVIAKDDTIHDFPIQQVKNIIQSQNGDILAAGRNGLYRIDFNTKEFKLIDELVPNTSSLAYATINSVEELTNKSLLIATNGEGLLIYNPTSKDIKKLKINSGMPSDIVQGIIALSDSSYWASTTKGLADIKIGKQDTLINIYDKNDGLSSTEYNYGSFRKLNDSLLAFGGVDGVTLFNPNNVENTSHTPKLVFDVFKLSNKIIEPGEKPLRSHINETESITLDHEENSLEIGFTGVMHSASSKLKYSWILEGFDRDWSVPTEANVATYTNLNSGDYTFKVRAFNKYGDYGETKSLAIHVLSPWWASNKAFVLYALAFIGLFLAIIHFTNVIVKKKNADEQIAFFNNITHEIKTPLAILISSLDNVTDRADSGVETKKRIKSTVKRINSLFEQMLNFHKVNSADTISQDISKIDLQTHIQKRINNFKPLSNERHLEIKFENKWNDAPFYYDKDIFDKIVLNLISNAIKYSFENGRININTSRTSLGELRMEISDEGLGIPKDQQKFILQRYYRARNVINSQRPGTGLGLMMVKKLLDKTGGSINFISEENKGTTFTVLLKNLRYEFDKQAASKESITNRDIDIQSDQLEISEFSDSKVLIVEDNDELRTLLADTLGEYFQIFEAQNGAEGLEIAATNFPDIILTDLIMPEMDGMQMSKKIKEDINLNHIPVFMLTVLQNSANKLESVETGISEYIEKPVDIKYLLAKMINTLKWQRNLREKYVNDNDAESAEMFRNKNDKEFLDNLEQRVLENLENEQFSVHDLSNSFGMSRTSLYMKLKNLVDLSPQDFIIHTKLKHSKELLIKGEYSIKEVAYQSGFSNPKYFSTSFKKFYKMTPSGFLESLKRE